jgi:dihydroneopterin aldolase
MGRQAVAVRNVEVTMRVGLLDMEKLEPQPIVVDVELWRACGPFTSGRHEDCIDYARIWTYLTSAWPPRPHTELLETLAEDLIAFCFLDPKVEGVRATLRKPKIFGGNGVPEVAVERVRGEVAADG